MTRRAKPRAERQRRRHRVTVGVEGATIRGMTGDISETGMFVMANELLPLRTRVQLQVELPEGVVRLEGEVARHHNVPRELRSVERQGMGIHLTRSVGGSAPHVVSHADGFRIASPTPEALRDFLAGRLQDAFLMLPCGTVSPGLMARAEVEVAVGPTVRTLAGTVVQVLEGEERAAVIHVHDRAALVALGGAPTAGAAPKA